MKKLNYVEATKLIEGLNDKYTTRLISGQYFIVSYNGWDFAFVDDSLVYRFFISAGKADKLFSKDKLPYNKKLYMILAELSMTPLEERHTKTCNVIISRNMVKSFVKNAPDSMEYYAWCKTSYGYALLATDKYSLENDEHWLFTDKEYNDLLKYIKELPDGKFQARVAEHGKTEV